jgi:hypothetical protein
MNFQSRVPLTANELARRAAALSANQPMQENQGGDAEPSRMADVENDPPEPSDERQYGPTAAQILRDAKRGVALASSDAKLGVFQQVASTLAEAVAGQWLPKGLGLVHK